MIAPPGPKSAPARPWLGFLCGLLVAWDAYAAYRLAQPMKAGHESFIGRQIGRSALNHLELGLGVTRGSNVSVVRQDGRPVVHRSYSPMASWQVALPMALGLDFDLSVRLPVLISSNLFLIGLWWLVEARWGARQADLSAMFAAFCPVFLFRYGLTCIFEILAIGPLMMAAALFARPRRDLARCGLIAGLAFVAVMDSWICWLVVVPALVRDWRGGHRRAALAIGSATVILPVVVHFLLLGLATGDLVGDVWYFFQHISERSSAESTARKSPVTYLEILGLLATRWRRGIGLVPAAFVLLGGLAIASRRRVPGWGWVVALMIMALPLNLARNIAYFHDFFIILFVPPAAICAGLGTYWLATRFEGHRARTAAVVLVMAAFLGLDVVPRYRLGSVFPKDHEQDAIARSIGEAVRPGDFVIANAEVCGIDPAVVPFMTDPQREQSPRPTYCGRMTQTVFVAANALDAERIARWARPTQRVILLEVGPDRFEPYPTFALARDSSSRLLVGVRRPEVAGLPEGIIRR
jgi:hypothetical protein